MNWGECFRRFPIAEPLPVRRRRRALGTLWSGSGVGGSSSRGRSVEAVFRRRRRHLLQWMSGGGGGGGERPPLLRAPAGHTGIRSERACFLHFSSHGWPKVNPHQRLIAGGYTLLVRMPLHIQGWAFREVDTWIQTKPMRTVHPVRGTYLFSAYIIYLHIKRIRHGVKAP